MTRFLPLRANLEWLKKAAKDRLKVLQQTAPEAQLSEVQQTLAQEYGFANWQSMTSHVEHVRDKISGFLPPPSLDQGEISSDDPDLKRFLAAIVKGEYQSILELLVSKPRLATSPSGDGTTPLHLAAQCNDAQLGVTLLCYGADPYATISGSGHTVLSWGVTCNSLDFVESLIRLGVKPDLYVAAGLGDVALLQSFFNSAGKLIPKATTTGSTRFSSLGKRLPCPPESEVEQISDAFCIACRNGHADAVRFLLTKQPDLTFRSYMGATALHWAHFSASAEVIAIIASAGSNQQSRDEVLGCVPLLFGLAAPASWGMLFLVKKQMQRSPLLVNFYDGHTTALHEAARAGHEHVVNYLLECGADRMLRNGVGRLASDLAKEQGHEGIAAMLRQ